MLNTGLLVGLLIVDAVLLLVLDMLAVQPAVQLLAMLGSAAWRICCARRPAHPPAAPSQPGEAVPLNADSPRADDDSFSFSGGAPAPAGPRSPGAEQVAA